MSFACLLRGRWPGWEVAVLECAYVGEQHAAGGAGGQVDLGADRVRDAGHLLERQRWSGRGAGLRAPAGAPACLGLCRACWPGRVVLLAARPACGPAVGLAGCFAAGGDRAFVEGPAAESGDRGGRGEGQAQQPEEEPADEGHRGGLVVGEGLAAVLHARRWPRRG